MPRLNQNQRLRAIGMLESGRRHADVAAQFCVSRVTATRLAGRYRTSGSVADRPCSGRPRVPIRAEDRHIWTSHLCNRFLTATTIAAATRAQNNRIGAQTVRRRLAEYGVRAWRPYNGLKFTRRHRHNRAQWVRQRIRWDQQQWNTNQDFFWTQGWTCDGLPTTRRTFCWHLCASSSPLRGR